MGLVRPEAANRLTLPVLMLVATFSIPHISSIAPFLTDISEEFDVSDGLAGQLGSASFAGTFLMAVVLTPFVGGLSLRRLMAAALILAGISTFLTAVIPSFWAVMATRVFAGLGAGMLGSSAIGSVARAWEDPATRVKRLGLVIAAFAGGPGLWAPLVRLSADASSWQFGVAIYAIITIVTGVLAWALLPELAGGPPVQVALKERIKTAVSLVRYPVLGQVYLTRAIMVASIGAIFTFIAAFGEHFYPGSDAWIGVMIAAAALGFMTMALASGLVISKLGGPTKSAIYFTIALAVFNSLLAWVTPNPAVTTFWLILWGGTAAILMTATQDLIFGHSGENQTSAVFLSGAIGPLGNVIGVVLGGIAFDAVADLSAYRWYLTTIGLLVIPPMIWAARQARVQRSLETAPAAD
jgi:predicted MFS family arabinose efflux permease